MCIQFLSENGDLLKAFHHTNINVPGNNAAVIKHANVEHSTKTAYVKSKYTYISVIYIGVFL